MRHGAIWAAAMAVVVVLLAGCGGEAATSAIAIETITATEASDLVAQAPEGLVVLDVRTPDEFATGHLAGAVNLDYYASDFADDLAALDREVPYLLYCRSGNRSAEARETMRGLGFTEVYEIAGGITAWTEAGLPLLGP